jgi:ankyrin repeat protein
MAIRHFIQLSDDTTVTLARLLLDHGANVHKRSSDGKTALQVATALGRTELVKLLEEKGASRFEANSRSLATIESEEDEEESEEGGKCGWMAVPLPAEPFRACNRT